MGRSAKNFEESPSQMLERVQHKEENQEPMRQMLENDNQEPTESDPQTVKLTTKLTSPEDQRRNHQEASTELGPSSSPTPKQGTGVLTQVIGGISDAATGVAGYIPAIPGTGYLPDIPSPSLSGTENYRDSAQDADQSGITATETADCDPTAQSPEEVASQRATHAATEASSAACLHWWSPQV